MKEETTKKNDCKAVEQQNHEARGQRIRELIQKGATAAMGLEYKAVYVSETFDEYSKLTKTANSLRTKALRLINLYKREGYAN